MKVAPGRIYEQRVARYIIVAINLPFGSLVAVNEIVIYRDILRRNAWIHGNLKVKVLATDIVPDDDPLCL